MVYAMLTAARGREDDREGGPTRAGGCCHTSGSLSWCCKNEVQHTAAADVRTYCYVLAATEECCWLNVPVPKLLHHMWQLARLLQDICVCHSNIQHALLTEVRLLLSS